MKVFKFIVGKEIELPRAPDQPSEVSYHASNCLAVVLAGSETEAREILASMGDDVRWLAVAKVIVFETDKARFVAGANY